MAESKIKSPNVIYREITLTNVSVTPQSSQIATMPSVSGYQPIAILYHGGNAPFSVISYEGDAIKGTSIAGSTIALNGTLGITFVRS